ncbi:MAG TPA: hypothetical protein PKM43_13920, partial [Verrucomicrobiota bacterium]|nr:hypothetical protein [Verrucomicrobiota bacterium]
SGCGQSTRSIIRERDVLAELAQHRAAAVNLSITTLDSDLARKIDPHPKRLLVNLPAKAALWFQAPTPMR